MEKLKEMIKDVGLIPMEINTSIIKIIMDVSALPQEYKEMSVMDGIKKYEEDFGVKIIPVDTSRNNTGTPHSPMIQVI